jgi:hypothetical protein
MYSRLWKKPLTNRPMSSGPPTNIQHKKKGELDSTSARNFGAVKAITRLETQNKAAVAKKARPNNNLRKGTLTTGEFCGAISDPATFIARAFISNEAAAIWPH